MDVRGAGLAGANRSIREAAAHAAFAGAARQRARAGIAAVDALLEVIEERHLAGARRAVRLQPEWRWMLENAGLTVPDAVSGASTTVELHDRLLDWQGDLFRSVHGERAEMLGEFDDDGEGWPASRVA